MNARDHAPPVESTLHEDPVELCQHLVRFDTTNPPGGERRCVEWIGRLLDAYGVEWETYAGDPERPNLIARIPGGAGEPLLAYGHVDVVPTTEQDWTHDPFGGQLADGYVWGRGTLDMKGGVAMYLAAFLGLAAAEEAPPGDRLLAILVDEEAGGDDGAAHLVETQPAALEGVRYAIGEFGGFSTTVRGERFYPVQVAEKQVCWLEVTFQGDAGHGSLPSDDDAMARMARFVSALDGERLPAHPHPVVEAMLEGIGQELAVHERLVLASLQRPRLADRILPRLGEAGDMFDPLLRNTVNETVVRGGGKENVVPERVTLTLDCRLLPGQGPADVIREIETLTGMDVTVSVERFDEAPPAPDMGGFDTLASVLETADPAGTVVPFMLPGASDARHLSHLGIQTYGFTPMQLPASFDFMSVIHAADERIPTAALEWGTERVREALWRSL